MKTQIVLCLMIVFLGAASAVAQPPAKSKTVSNIRQVDFQNFTYTSTLCSQEYGRQGIPRLVPVRQGEFKKRNAFFTVAKDEIVYADVTGDGHEDAIVPVDCGNPAANFSNAEIFIYTIQSGRATLLTEVNDKDLERDYRRSFADAESYWGIADKGVKVNSGKLEIDVLADGPHAGPKYIATLKYGLSGKTMRLEGKPERRASPNQ